MKMKTDSFPKTFYLAPVILNPNPSLFIQTSNLHASIVRPPNPNTYLFQQTWYSVVNITTLLQPYTHHTLQAS